MKTEGGCVLEAAVEEEDNVVLNVVDQPKWADAAGFETQITLHAFG